MPTVLARPTGFCLAFLTLVTSLGIPLQAQQLSVIRPGSFEIGPFIGASYGVDETRVMGGGNVTFAVNKYILPYAEYSYFPGIGRNTTGTFVGTGASFSAHYAIPLSDFHGGVHIRIPIHESPIVPYGVFGLGGLHHSQGNFLATCDSCGGTVSVPSTSGTDFAVNFGGGLRYYLNPHYGFRVEAKAYKPTGTYNQVFGKAEFGFFIQLH